MVVYWIHLKEHTDIAKDGYVGVSVNFKSRMYRHKKITPTLNCHFGNAINKYGWDNLVKEVIFEGSKDECYLKEKEFRNSFQVGWNEAVGGLGGDRSKFIDYKVRKNLGWNYDTTGHNNPFFNKSHSLESLKKMSKTKCKAVITTPDGIFYGFRDLSRFYKINKITAEKWANKKEEWICEYK
jgi:group I intron endonuclease